MLSRKDDPPPATLWSRLRHGSDDRTVGERVRAALLKPAPESKDEPEPEVRTLEELRAAERSADDRERFFGLIAAPVAAAIALVVTSYLVGHDPSAYLKNGQVNPLHSSVGTYHLLELVLLALAFAMLATAWYRKRLFLGISMALYGLAIFNLHYWGFGVPFLLGGSWYLVRAYRAHQAVRSASGEGNGSGTRPARPRANKRYTPPI
jgi:hypothetical protein